MVGLLLAPGFVVFAFVGGGVRSRLTRAIWDLDRDNAPKPWKRTWLMDLDDEAPRTGGLFS